MKIQPPYKSQYIAAILHLGVFLFCARLAFCTSSDALSETVWFVLALPDLPVTILFFLILQPISMEHKLLVDELFRNIFTIYPFYSFWHFWYVTIMYGILGTVWWFYIPRIVIGLKDRLSKKRIKDKGLT